MKPKIKSRTSAAHGLTKGEKHWMLKESDIVKDIIMMQEVIKDMMDTWV